MRSRKSKENHRFTAEHVLHTAELHVLRTVDALKTVKHISYRTYEQREPGGPKVFRFSWPPPSPGHARGGRRLEGGE